MPGLAVIILTMTLVLFTAVALVREREHGNLELLITTPIHPLELMVGKLVPYIFVGLVQIIIILGLGWLVFNVPLQGELHDLVAVILPFIAASLTLGLLLSTIAATQMQAMQMTFFLLLLSVLLSGFMFPYDAMPRAAQYIAEILPATHFMRLIRGVYLRGATAATTAAGHPVAAGLHRHHADHRHQALPQVAGLNQTHAIARSAAFYWLLSPRLCPARPAAAANRMSCRATAPASCTSAMAPSRRGWTRTWSPAFRKAISSARCSRGWR